MLNLQLGGSLVGGGFGGGAAPAWSPTDLASLYEWWDTTQDVTSASNKVSAWTGQGDDTITLAQGSASKQPTTGITTMNGVNVITTDEFNDSLITGSLTLPNSATIFITMNTNADDSYVPICDGLTTGRFAFIAQISSSTTTLSANSGTPTYRKNGVAQTFANRGAAYTAFNTGDNILVIESANLSAWGTLQIGEYYQSTGLLSNLDYGDIIVLDNTATTADKNNVGNYLADKFGMTWTTI